MMSSSHVFISYSTEDKKFVKKLADDLNSAGITVWIDTQGLKPGTPDWEKAIRDAIRSADVVLLIASPASRESRYVRDELLIAEMYEREVIALWAKGAQWADCVRMGLIGTQYIDGRGRKYTSALLETVASLNSLITAGVPSVPIISPESDFEPRNPYKGLRAFTGKDRGDFFGRDKLITELIEALKENTDTNRFLAIVGASGSGKSSVVMAGLLPRLQENALPGSRNWVYLDPVLPGAQPLESLAVILADALKISTSDVLKDLDTSSRGLHLLSRRLTKERDSRLVLLVDQFEELFTQTTDADERSHFIELLVTAATVPAGQTIVLITLRADFYDRPMNYPELGKLLEKRAKSVLPMDIDDLREVIEKPATLPDVQLEFESGLVSDLLFEVYGQPGALPLLQFTLDQLVEKRQGRLLALFAYKELGGVKGALARHAESTYQQLPSHQHRELTRALFLRLIEPGTTEQDTTRRRAYKNEIVTANPKETEIFNQLVKIFVSARLLTINLFSETPTIEVSHEALIREWGLLGDWLRTARDDVRLQQIISRDTQEWIRHGQRSDDLYRGAKLSEAKDWSRRNTPSSEELHFIQAAVSEQEIEEQREQLRERKLDDLRNAIILSLPHELRTPLAGILGFSNILKDEHQFMSQEKVSEIAGYIFDAAQRLYRLAENYLVFAQLELMASDAAHVKILREATTEGPRAIIEDAVGLKAQQYNREADLSLSVADDAEIHILEDSLQKIVEELIDNAFKFSVPGKIVRIATHSDSNWYYIYITDFGRGMTTEQISDVGAFMQFERKNYEQQGGGLGLAIAQDVVKIYGGELTIESIPNEYTTVSIKLPLVSKDV
jgi:signal transduction histidine kinase